MQKNNPTNNFGAYLDRTIKIIKHNYTRSFKKNGVDITTEQWVLLDSLNTKNGVAQNELANDSFKNAPTVSRIIDLLVKKGLIERKPSPTDRRSHLIYLTKKGRNIYAKALPVVEGLRRKGWEGLNDEDYDHLLRILDTILGNFKENK